MWYCIWFIGMCLTLVCTVKFISKMEAKSAFDTAADKAG